MEQCPSLLVIRETDLNLKQLELRHPNSTKVRLELVPALSPQNWLGPHSLCSFYSMLSLIPGAIPYLSTLFVHRFSRLSFLLLTTLDDTHFEEFSAVQRVLFSTNISFLWCCNKIAYTGWLQGMEIIVSYLEASSLNQDGTRDLVPLKPVEKESFASS